eukprot:TRINITY_DN4003_c0_g5_i1.p1 TRINITY_DN4003_c0_g5~~TRINITY_DN4003_c0_g5_i1.p1  ORF type:complete len:155 (-),score=49.40 TRINITY_DN4003_c0_g5_i1:67-531(-)
MKLLPLMLLLESLLAEPLITVKRAKELKRTVEWKVGNPKKNPLRRYTIEEFKGTVRGNHPVTHEAVNKVQPFLPNMTHTEIKFFLEGIASKAKGSPGVEETVAGEELASKTKGARNLGEDRWWEEFDDWEDDEMWEYDEYPCTCLLYTSPSPRD